MQAQSEIMVLIVVSPTDCTICYNESGSSSSQAVCSARLDRVGHPTTTPSLIVFHRVLAGDQPCRFPHPASTAFCVSQFWSSCTGRLHLSGQRCLDWIRRSVLLCPYCIELSHSKK